MNIYRRRALVSTLRTAVAFGLGGAQALGRASAEESRAVSLLVGFPGGGGPDVIARLVAEKLRTSLKRTLIVENVVGAGGRYVLETVNRRPADGNSYVLTPSGMLTISPHVYKKLGYDPLNDFDPVGGVCTYSYALAVGPGTGARTLAEFLSWCKANPGKANYGVPALGAATHFLGWLLSRDSSVPLTVVPYKGGPALTQAVLSGEIPAAINLLSSFKSLHDSRRLSVVAVSGVRRSLRMPEVPTFAESGFQGCTVEEFMCVLARKGVPEAAIDSMASGVRDALETPDVRQALLNQDFEPAPVAAAVVAKWIRDGSSRWGNVVKSSGYRVAE